jgi:hypothetical protein
VTLFSAAVLAACGGGGGSSTGTTGGTAGSAAYTSGAISGFGSVIVNGVRFDTSSVAVEDDDGASHSADELRLGDSVEIESGPIDASTQTAVATVIRYGSEIKAADRGGCQWWPLHPAGPDGGGGQHDGL